MILTVTLNTSIDRLYLMDHVEQETVMRVREVHNTPGGKGLNVSRVAQQLHEPVTAMGFIGGFHGKYLEDMIKQTGITPCFTHVKAETRSCINIWDLSDQRSTEYLEPGAPVSAEDVDRFMADFSEHLPEADTVTISGSVPAGVPLDIYARMIIQCREKKIPVLLDTSGALLQNAVRACPTLIKPNEDEIRVLTDLPPVDRGSMLRAMRRIARQGIEYVVLSLGAQGAILAANGKFYLGRPPHIDPKNTVGCGDSMLAGFAVGVARGWPIEQSFRTALAVSAANAENLLTGCCEEKDYEALLPGVEIREIS